MDEEFIKEMREIAEYAESRDMDRNKLANYWKHGKGAAKIRWGTPGSWTRCRRHLLKHVGPGRAERMCSQWYRDVTGHWIGSEKGKNPLGPG